MELVLLGSLIGKVLTLGGSIARQAILYKENQLRWHYKRILLCMGLILALLLLVLYYEFNHSVTLHVEYPDMTEPLIILGFLVASYCICVFQFDRVGMAFVVVSCIGTIFCLVPLLSLYFTLAGETPFPPHNMTIFVWCSLIKTASNCLWFKFMIRNSKVRVILDILLCGTMLWSGPGKLFSFVKSIAELIFCIIVEKELFTPAGATNFLYFVIVASKRSDSLLQTVINYAESIVRGAILCHLPETIWSCGFRFIRLCILMTVAGLIKYYLPVLSTNHRYSDLVFLVVLVICLTELGFCLFLYQKSAKSDHLAFLSLYILCDSFLFYELFRGQTQVLGKLYGGINKLFDRNQCSTTFNCSSTQPLLISQQSPRLIARQKSEPIILEKPQPASIRKMKKSVRSVRPLAPKMPAFSVIPNSRRHTNDPILTAKSQPIPRSKPKLIPRKQSQLLICEKNGLST